MEYGHTAFVHTIERRKHFNPDGKHGNFGLPDHGHQKVRCSNPPCGPHAHATDKLHDHVERAMYAHFRFDRDQHLAEI